MSNFTVMFIDLVDSTKLKHEFAPEDAFDVVKWLWSVVRLKGEFRKFTGDGAMFVFREKGQGPLKAIETAEQIIQEVDGKNLAFQRVAELYNRSATSRDPRTGSDIRIRLRIGIATGSAAEFSHFDLDVIGKTPDLAARLCSEADTDGILIDDATKVSAMRDNPSISENSFKKCDRRLMLKGVPKGDDEFWHFKPTRLVLNPADGPYAGGILKVFTHRELLNEAFPAGRLLRLAQPNSTILAAGRTLKFWAVKIFNSPEYLKIAVEKKLKFQFLVSSLESCSFLDRPQVDTIRRDRDVAFPIFWNMQQKAGGFEFELRETSHLFLDGVIFVNIGLPGGPESKPNTRIAFQDINAVDSEAQKHVSSIRDDPKATILLACICNNESDRKGLCKVCGLHERTQNIYDHHAFKLDRPPSKSLVTILNGHDLGLGTRNNRPSNYLHSVLPYFECIKDGKLDQVPPPICVQLQVSTRCSTNCVMCHHWTPHGQPVEMGLGNWKKIFTDLSRFGVKTAIFSGGEPLMREELPELLRSAQSAGLRLGMLTNGTMNRPLNERKEVIAAIAECVDWISISIDGTEAADRSIRNPQVTDRSALLKEFVSGVQSGRKPPKVWATVTLQKGNAAMDFQEACRFIQSDIGISEVNFKIATGARNALEREPIYLLSEAELRKLVEYLQNDSLPNQVGNQLAYLRECFRQKTFSVEDAAQGAPLRTFYKRNHLRCFTPFLFALIDSDGEVYPCCHLYRDNQGTDPKSGEFRQHHSMGNALKNSFREVWNGSRYLAERVALTEVDPDNPKFFPCGECTRHCQHNLVLSDIYRNYEHNLTEFANQVKTLEHGDGQVFF